MANYYDYRGHLSEIYIHPVVAGDEVSVVRLSILQFHQHGMVLRRAQQRQRQHF